jgi:hypothetical protein
MLSMFLHYASFSSPSSLFLLQFLVFLIKTLNTKT